MKNANDKYKRTIEILKKSRAVLDSTDAIEREVLIRISSSVTKEPESFSIFNFLFGWTEIVWIRRSLITVSVMLVAIFIYQQSMIVKQLNWLSTQIVINQERPVYTTQSDLVSRMKLLKISGSRIQHKNSTISEQQLDMLIESFDRLQTDYDNLMKIIQENPELKEMIEKKLREKNLTKVKL
jgi:hypothetical protein